MVWKMAVSGPRRGAGPEGYDDALRPMRIARTGPRLVSPPGPLPGIVAGMTLFASRAKQLDRPYPFKGGMVTRFVWAG